MRRKPQNGNKSSAATTTWAPKQGRPTQAIIENNRKTELCRNWQKGACTYGGRCAFAHGSKELKYRTLREMENAGRIPDASKYRCYPCMTWVATGSCPYASRCVFIHDLRVKGPVEAWLYAGCLAKSPTACPSSDSFFFFPDITRDPDSTELPTHPAQYDLDSRTPDTGETSSRAVYNLWYSFVSTLVEEEATNESNASPASNSTSSSSAKTPNLLPASTLDVNAANKRSKNPASASAAAAAAALTATKGAATSRRQASKPAQTNCKLGAGAADPGSPSGILHQSGSTTAIPTPTTTATTTNTTTSAIAASTATGFPQASRQRHLLRENRRPRGSVKHLPVFEGLSRGAPACPISPLPPMAGNAPPPVTLVEGAGGSFWDDSGSEEIMFLDSYDSSCAGSSFSLDTEEISMPPTPRMAMSQSTDSESYYTSAPPELRCHIYSCEHLRLLKPGRLPPFSAASLNRDDSWVSDSAGNPSDIGQVTDDAINVQDSGGGSVVVQNPPPTIASVATKSVRSGYAVVHHRQQGCAGVGPHGGTVDAALRKRGSIHAVPSF